MLNFECLGDISTAEANTADSSVSDSDTTTSRDTVAGTAPQSLKSAAREAAALFAALEKSSREQQALLATLDSEIRIESKAEGYRLGFEQGRREGKELAIASCFALEELRAKFLAASQETILGMVFEISRAVLRAELAQDVSSIKSRLTAALEQVLQEESITLYLSPADEQFLRSYALKVAQQKNLKISLELDETMAQGDLRIKTSLGLIECSVEEHLRGIECLLKREGEVVASILSRVLNNHHHEDSANA